MNGRRAWAYHLVREPTERIAHQALLVVETVRQRTGRAHKIAPQRGEFIRSELRRNERIVHRPKICRGHPVVGRTNR